MIFRLSIRDLQRLATAFTAGLPATTIDFEKGKVRDRYLGLSPKATSRWGWEAGERIGRR